MQLPPFHPRQWRLALLVLALAGALTLALAGCGGSTGSASPLAAASVNGHPIPLSEYQGVLQVYLASAQANGQTVSWQSPAGRTGYAQQQQAALDFVIGLELSNEQLAHRHHSVTAKDLASYVANIEAARKQYTQSGQAPATRALAQALTPSVITLLATQAADEAALAQLVLVPTAHVSGMLLKTRQQALALEQQVQHGASFAALARKNSTDSASAAQGGDLGTVYIGQIGPQFDAQVFAPGAHPAQYLIDSINGEYALLAVSDISTAPLKGVTDAQTQSTVFDGWVLDYLKPAAQVQQYVTIG